MNKVEIFLSAITVYGVFVYLLFKTTEKEMAEDLKASIVEDPNPEPAMMSLSEHVEAVNTVASADYTAAWQKFNENLKPKKKSKKKVKKKTKKSKK